VCDNKHHIVPCPVGQDYALCYHTLWFAETNYFHTPLPTLPLSHMHACTYVNTNTHTQTYTVSHKSHTYAKCPHMQARKSIHSLYHLFCIVKCGAFCNESRQKLLFTASYTCQNKAFSTDTEHKLVISSDFDARSSQK